jgi:hypothetical protein
MKPTKPPGMSQQMYDSLVSCKWPAFNEDVIQAHSYQVQTTAREPPFFVL